MPRRRALPGALAYGKEAAATDAEKSRKGYSRAQEDLLGIEYRSSRLVPPARSALTGSSETLPKGCCAGFRSSPGWQRQLSRTGWHSWRGSA